RTFRLIFYGPTLNMDHQSGILLQRFFLGDLLTWVSSFLSCTTIGMPVLPFCHLILCSISFFFPHMPFLPSIFIPPLFFAFV
ncbi:unnamed protein product, partial [Musa textilis]